MGDYLQNSTFTPTVDDDGDDDSYDGKGSCNEIFHFS